MVGSLEGLMVIDMINRIDLVGVVGMDYYYYYYYYYQDCSWSNSIGYTDKKITKSLKGGSF